MFVADLQSVFIKLETITLTSSMTQQFGGTEGTLSTLANGHNLLEFIQCDPTLVLELGFIHHLLQLHPPAPAVTLLYGSSKLRGGIGRESRILKQKSFVDEKTFSDLKSLDIELYDKTPFGQK